MAIKRRSREKSEHTTVLQRAAIKASQPCPINKNIGITMTRSALIAACGKYTNPRGGANAGKRGASICDDCMTGAAIREGKKKFPLPTGIKLYTIAEFDRLKAVHEGRNATMEPRP
ncbi:MAG: hypothetical protein VR65_06160 [Desulfobulbaceae bacterium BRH_c16a]|nr:MAG: hypothetical protein VR65_06160 [Desulfobulbaceae bacterium BRH_c16a]